MRSMLPRHEQRAAGCQSLPIPRAQWAASLAPLDQPSFFHFLCLVAGEDLLTRRAPLKVPCEGET